MGPTENENENTTKSEAIKIGKTFAMFLLTTTEPSAAVDAWTKDNKELKDLMETDWFEPMMNAIAKGLLKSSNLGLKWRVGLGAGLSIMDMITDTGVINSYRVSGNTKGAYSLMAMIGSNMAVQLLFTYAQNRKKSKWVILREFAFVVTFLKPGVDAYRVATGHEDEDAVVSPLQEMGFGKAAELAFESIPGGLLQAYFFINSPNKTLFLLISILISTLTTGFASALISYDMDISVANRKEVPLFYGYIKDGNTERMITLILQVSERELSGGGVVNRAKLTFDSLGADPARQLPQPQPHNRHRSAVLSEQEANVRRDPCRNCFVPSLQGGEEGLRALGSRP
jgi:zinc transporter ZupT